MIRKPEDMLREEYFLLLPDIRRTLMELEARIRHTLIEAMRDLEQHERIEIRSRIKDCERAIDSLRRRQPTRAFEASKPHTLLDLKDLAGARIAVFPRKLMRRIDDLLKNELHSLGQWDDDHIFVEPWPEPLILKYRGILSPNLAIVAEYQIAPLLITYFWEVEHDAIYKPSPELRSAEKFMHDQIKNVYRVLTEFEDSFEHLLLRTRRRRRAMQMYTRRRRS